MGSFFKKIFSVSKINLFFYSLILFISLISTYRLLGNGIILFDDGFFPFNPRAMLLKELSLFNYQYFLGGPYNYIYNYLPFTIFSFFGISLFHLPYWVDDFLYISFLQAIGSIGIFKLIKELSSSAENTKLSSLGAFFGSVFYMLNFNKLTTINEFYPVLISISFLPLISFYILRFYKGESIRIRPLFYVAILSLTMASGYYESTFTLIIVLGILSIMLYPVMFFRYNKKTKTLKFLILITTIIVSSIWILPSLWVNTYAGFAVAPSTISGTSSLVNEINYGHGLTLEAFLTFYFPLAAFPLLPMALGKYLNDYIYSSIGLFFSIQLFLLLPKRNKLKNKIKYFDSLIFLLFVFALIDWPSQLFLYHFVFGILFTLTIGWEYWIFMFWFSIVMGLAITAFSSSGHNIEKVNIFNDKERFKRIKRKIVITANWIPPIIICILILAYSVPIAEYPGAGVNNQNIGVVTSNFHPSQSLINTGNYLSNHSAQGNILELPIIAGDYLLNSTHPDWQVGTPLGYFTCSYIDYRDRSGDNNTLTYPILNNFQEHPNGNLSNYLSLFGVKYVVLIRNMDTGNYIVKYNLSNFISLEHYLNSSKGFKYINSFGNYTIFSLNNTNQLIYASNAYDQCYYDPGNSTVKLYNAFASNRFNSTNDSLFYGLNRNITHVNQKDVVIKWKKTSINTYKVEIDANKTFALNFLMGYSISWGSYHWILKINGTRSNNEHFISNLFANGWIMPRGNYSAIICLSYANQQNLAYEISFIPLFVLFLISTATFIRLKVMKLIHKKR